MSEKNFEDDDDLTPDKIFTKDNWEWIKGMAILPVAVSVLALFGDDPFEMITAVWGFFGGIIALYLAAHFRLVRYVLVFLFLLAGILQIFFLGGSGCSGNRIIGWEC